MKILYKHLYVVRGFCNSYCLLLRTCEIHPFIDKKMFQFNQTLGCLRKTPTETAECLKLVLVKSRGLPNETTDKMTDKFKPELVQCSNKITGYLTDSITHTHILQQVSNTHLCIFLV